MWVDLEGEGELTFNTSVGRVKEENVRRDPRVRLSHADAAGPFGRVRISGGVVRFTEGEETHDRMDQVRGPGEFDHGESESGPADEQ